MKIAILSTEKLPEFLGKNHPNEEELFSEDLVLVDAFSKHGVTAERISWHHSGANWPDYDCILVRSTWDYIDDPHSYFKVLDEIKAAGSYILNPVETIKWNSNKRYLTELEKLGVSIVPTVIIETALVDKGTFQTIMSENSPGYVVKPLIGVGAYATQRYSGISNICSDVESGILNPPLLVQPFIPAVQSEGELSFIFASRDFLYSVVKVPDKGDFRTQIMHGAKTYHMEPSAKDISSAENVIDKISRFAHLARVDMVRTSSGELALMELELIEPQLYLHVVKNSADIIVEVTFKHLSER